jgi:hypothetical protein
MVDTFLKGVELAWSFLTRSKSTDASLAARTANLLKSVQTAVKHLGQEAQQLHAQVARIDLQARDVDATVGNLSARVGRYLYDDRFSPIVTGTQKELIVLRSQFASHAGAALPSARREKMEQANADLNDVIEKLDEFAAKFLTLSRHIPAGTGLGAGTLKQMDEWLMAGKWRSNPSAAQDCWQRAAAEFQDSPEYREWREVHDALGKVAQRLVTAFPEVRSK